MLLKKQLNKNSTKRFTISHYFIHKHLIFYKQYTTWYKKNCTNNFNIKTILHRKFKKKKELKYINQNFFFKNISVIINYSNYTSKPKEFVVTKNIYNQINLLPTANFFYPGFKLYPYLFLNSCENIKQFIGQFTPLIFIPINMPISFIFNKLNTNTTYIKSSGAKGIRKKINRHDKTINVTLPSTELKIFPITTLALFSNSLNLGVNRIVEGS